MGDNAKLYFYCISQRELFYILAHTEREGKRKINESVHFLIIMICILSGYIWYTPIKCLLNMEIWLTTISSNSVHLRIPGQSVESSLKVKVLERMILLSCKFVP